MLKISALLVTIRKGNVIISVNVTLVDLMLQPLQIKIVYNLVVPVAMYLYESFENNSLYVPSNVYNMTECGIKTKHSLVFSTYGIYFGGPPK